MKTLTFLLIICTLVCGCIEKATELSFIQSDTKVASILYSDTTHVIEFGTPEIPYSGTPELKIMVDDKILFDSSLCNSNSFADYIDQNEHYDVSTKTGFSSHPECQSMRSEEPWGDGAQSIDLLVPQKRKDILPYDEARRQDIKVVVQNDIVRAIRIVDLRRDPQGNMIQIKIGDLPWKNSQLNKKECIQLFGKPIKERRYLPQ